MSHFSTNYTTEIVSTTEKSVEADDSKYLIIPLVIILIMLLSVLVYLMAKRRKMNRLRLDVLKLYDFDSNEQEWESLTNNEYPFYGNGSVTTKF